MSKLTLAGGTSGATAVLIVWLAGHFGLTDVTGEVGAAFASVLTTGVLLLGHYGIRGIARILWRGQSS